MAENESEYDRVKAEWQAEKQREAAASTREYVRRKEEHRVTAALHSEVGWLREVETDRGGSFLLYSRREGLDGALRSLVALAVPPADANDPKARPEVVYGVYLHATDGDTVAFIVDDEEVPAHVALDGFAVVACHYSRRLRALLGMDGPAPPASQPGPLPASLRDDDEFPF